jgi:hypothetical protein
VIADLVDGHDDRLHFLEVVPITAQREEHS